MKKHWVVVLRDSWGVELSRDGPMTKRKARQWVRRWRGLEVALGPVTEECQTSIEKI